MNTPTPRFNGTLKKWNVERGFGFLVAEHGDQELFVHVSAFPRDGRPPTVGEALTFEIELDRDQRKRAVRLQRPGAKRAARAARPNHSPQAQDLRAHRRTHSSSQSTSLGSVLVAIALLAGLGWYVYSRYAGVSEGVRGVPQSLMGGAVSVTRQPQQPAFQCDGRQHCSQMSSCEEAKFFLQNCPDPKMDGDGDGVPCEQQLCNGFFGN
ncbi:excalibur calcium-binding domain-containing protein [Hydrogenophaga sp. PAMC20947]|uniref:excalibur calcium-binding domain-containing protein n=1 Tax=Hydrogenophaga sp. PAMC20947 TaxID=2565558 RepID=UPI00109E1DEE|nr:excalibur calcium-binding domain-containing protein [Hydrogenophaga sp. PAMC20947]QCB46287.1 cold-shock protein [Hydrogenophaga sp. PAMC20947]